VKEEVPMKSSLSCFLPIFLVLSGLLLSCQKAETPPQMPATSGQAQKEEGQPSSGPAEGGPSRGKTSAFFSGHETKEETLSFLSDILGKHGSGNWSGDVNMETDKFAVGADGILTYDVSLSAGGGGKKERHSYRVNIRDLDSGSVHQDPRVEVMVVEVRCEGQRGCIDETSVKDEGDQKANKVDIMRIYLTFGRSPEKLEFGKALTHLIRMYREG
jgi:hypothetical protein